MPTINVTDEQFRMMRDSGVMDPSKNPRIAAAASRMQAASAPSTKDIGSFLDQGPVIAGHQCRPLTLGTLLLLQRIQSPLATGLDSDDPVKDALTALWILAGPEDEVVRSTRDKDLLFDSTYQFSKDIGIEKMVGLTAEMRSYFDSIGSTLATAGTGVEKKANQPRDGGTPTESSPSAVKPDGASVT